MALNLSLSEILANLEKRIESLRGEVELHARQEEHHREQRSRFEAELQKAMEHLGSFRAAAATAEELDLPADGRGAQAPRPGDGLRARARGRCTRSTDEILGCDATGAFRSDA
jgi:hypothetical protein